MIVTNSDERDFNEAVRKSAQDSLNVAAVDLAKWIATAGRTKSCFDCLSTSGGHRATCRVGRILEHAKTLGLRME